VGFTQGLVALDHAARRRAGESTASREQTNGPKKKRAAKTRSARVGHVVQRR